MAEIQSALPAKFLQIAGAHKAGHKELVAASAQLASFFGVLKSQMAKSDAVDETIALDIKADTLHKPLQVQSDAAPAVLAANSFAPQMPALSNDPALAAAVNASMPVSNANAPAVDVAVEMTQSDESDSILVRPRGEVDAKPLGSAKPEALLKTATAANAAGTGQGLPLTATSRQADGAPVAPDAKLEAKIEAVVSPTLSTPVAPRAEAVASQPVSLGHSFEQALRQVETKTHAAIEAPLRSASFVAELADKVVWLAGRQGQMANLSLNPPEMGALEVRLTVSGGDATAQFFSPNPGVRDAIDAALPKLRELMAQAGLNLGEAEVRDQAFGRRDNSEMQGQASAKEIDAAVNQAALAGIGAVRSAGVGLVDLYI